MDHLVALGDTTTNIVRSYMDGHSQINKNHRKYSQTIISEHVSFPAVKASSSGTVV